MRPMLTVWCSISVSEFASNAWHGGNGTDMRGGSSVGMMQGGRGENKSQCGPKG